MGQGTGLVAIDVEGDEQLEFLEGLLDAATVRHRDQRIAAGDEERAQLPVARGEDLGGQRRGRQLAVALATA